MVYLAVTDEQIVNLEHQIAQMVREQTTQLEHKTRQIISDEITRFMGRVVTHDEVSNLVEHKVRDLELMTRAEFQERMDTRDHRMEEHGRAIGDMSATVVSLGEDVKTLSRNVEKVMIEVVSNTKDTHRDLDKVRGMLEQMIAQGTKRQEIINENRGLIDRVGEMMSTALDKLNERVTWLENVREDDQKRLREAFAPIENLRKEQAANGVRLASVERTVAAAESNAAASVQMLAQAEARYQEDQKRKTRRVRGGLIGAAIGMGGWFIGEVLPFVNFGLVREIMGAFGIGG